MKWLRSPALHMVAIGGLMFGVSLLRGGAGFGDRPRIVVAAHRLDLMLETFVAEKRRAATREERQRMLDMLIDDEVLYQYALALGMHKNPAAQRRLAKIADFVAANPHAGGSEAERATEAMELGLHHGDLVVRRILVDSARRLIRAVVLLQEPSQELVEDYLAAHREEHLRPARSRISQVAVNGFKWPDSETRARLLLGKIRSESLDVDQALALGDGAFVSPSLPALTGQSLASKFGADFAAAVMALPAGGWADPIASRYGHHLVYVHQRFEATVPPLAEIRERVVNRLLHKLADEWLALRLKELRLEYEIVTPASTS